VTRWPPTWRLLSALLLSVPMYVQANASLAGVGVHALFLVFPFLSVQNFVPIRNLASRTDRMPKNCQRNGQSDSSGHGGVAPSAAV